MWRKWRKLSYFHFQSKTLWRIPDIEDVLSFTNVFFLIHIYWISKGISKVDIPQKRIKAKINTSFYMTNANNSRMHNVTLSLNISSNAALLAVINQT